MAWTDPASFSNLEVVTFTKLNTHLRDNMRELWHELAYVEFTSNVSVTATTEATANSIVSAGALTYVANPIFIEFECYAWAHDTAVGDLDLVLYDGSTSQGLLWEHKFATSGGAIGGLRTARRLTPTAASHTYSIRGFTNTGTATVSAGVGGVGAAMPGFIRITQKGGA